jgi:hypothetical protein
MKLRFGFVSNSSSSSFVLVVKGDGKLTEQSLLKAFNVPESSPMYKLTKKVVHFLVKESKKVPSTELLKYYYVDDIEELSDYIQKAVKDGSTVYGGSACSNGGGIEQMICEMEFNYEDENIGLYKEGGY